MRRRKVSKAIIPIKPCGYRMLVKQVVQENKSAGGIIMGTDEEHTRQQAGFPMYEVLAQGPAVYQSRDGNPFPEGKWCEVGDIVLMDGYAGKQFSPKEFERYNDGDEETLNQLREMERMKLKFHLVSDDSVMGVLVK
jgi:co-chaperonin GroES (HSP10)